MRGLFYFLLSFFLVGEIQAQTITLLKPKNDSIDTPTRLDLYWEHVSGMHTYEVHLDTSPLFNSVILQTITLPANYKDEIAGKKIYLMVNVLRYGTTYYWKVKAIGGGGGAPIFSSVGKFKTLVRPKLVSPASGPLPTLPTMLKFQYNQGSQKYRVQIGNTVVIFTSPIYNKDIFSDVWFTHLQEFPVSMTGVPLANGVDYVWRVKEYNALPDSSQWSEVWTFGVPKEGSSIDESTHNGQAGVYPNPANSFIYLNESLKGLLVVQNTLGEIVLEKEITDTNEKIDISTLPNGLYRLLIRNGSDMSVQKLLVIR